MNGFFFLLDHINDRHEKNEGYKQNLNAPSRYDADADDDTPMLLRVYTMHFCMSIRNEMKSEIASMVILNIFLTKQNKKMFRKTRYEIQKSAECCELYQFTKQEH